MGRRGIPLRTPAPDFALKGATSRGPMNEQSLFIEALDRTDPAEREALLDRCPDPAVRARVERLLKRHEQPGPSFFDTPAKAVVAIAEAHDAAVATFERPGSVVSHYQLLEQIGEGGFGVVFRAVQLHPIRREVALKVIKPGMDSRQVIARFEAERQALAMMDHPNIARVLDAGRTDSGRPFFVMELVRGGVPITDYSDRHGLSLSRRLELFVPVCRAVQHAHTKGMIHRDLKPTNILVAEEDGAAVPKVIDFGVAKATGSSTWEGSLSTTGAQLIGTPLYMSPEQADWGGARRDVDTRSDVYALGAVLYELLAGVTPFDRDRLRTVGYDEVRRIIREEDPPPPSAAVRGGQSGGFRGELDWIVLKALDKDRERRYQTAGALAADLGRYLNDEPVAACPPSVGYRLRKWARRNKVPFAVALSAVALVVAGVAGLVVSNARTRAAQGRAEVAQRVAEERAGQVRLELDRLKAANVLLERGRWYSSRSRWDDADQAYTRAINLRPDHASVWGARGELYAHLGLWDLAAPDIAREVELCEPDYATRWLQHALLRLATGDVQGCRAAADRMRERFGGTLMPDAAHDLVRVCLLAPPVDGPAGTSETRGLVSVSERLVEYHPGSAFALLVLGTAQVRAGQNEAAVQSLRKAVAASDWEPRHLAWPTLAIAHHRLGRSAEARAALSEAAAVLGRWNEARAVTDPARWILDYGAGRPWPVPWWDWLDCYLRYREAREAIDGTPPADDDPRQQLLRARAFAGLRKSGQAVAAYEAALALRPADEQIRLETHRARAFDHVKHAAWARAADEYAKATELRPDDINLWRFRATAHFLARDDVAYRQACAATFERFGRTTDLATACRTVEACVLSADALPDPRALLPTSEVAERLWHYGPTVRGAALYRAGEYRRALECFERMPSLYRPRAWDWCFCAMAHHRLGNAAEARRCLGEAARWIEDADRYEGDNPTAAQPAWGDWLESPVSRRLLAEASDLVGGR
jgi:serine/threonine protein kinase/predicted Zn-dependent protease